MEELKDTIDNGESEVLVVPKGEFFGSDSKGNAVQETIDDEVIAGLESKLDGKELLVDKDHSSMKEGQDRDTSAMGWMHSFKKKADGLWAKISWTDIGKKLIENRVFRFLSPSFILEDAKPTEMLNVGLTNQPAFKEAAAPIINHTPVSEGPKEDLTTLNEETYEMTKEEITALVNELVDAKLAEALAALEAAKEAEVKEEVKEEIKEEVVDNACSEEKAEEAKNEEPDVKVEVVDEMKKEEVKEEVEEAKEATEDKEVIKLEALNSQPKTEGLDIVKNSISAAAKETGYAIVTRVM